MAIKSTVMIYPMEGAYQHSLTSSFVRETKTLVIARPKGSICDWKFNKKDRLRVGVHKNEFPRYKIDEWRQDYE